MLLELRVENYAVIDNVLVEFGPGLNLLTGETGAGKSILIDALALLLGEKASTDVVRHGTDKAVVSAVFEFPDAASAVLEANGLDSDGDALILRREITAGAKGRVFVNNQPATVAVLKQLAPLLGSIHAQNESILSFDAAARLELLDLYAAANRQPTTQAFETWRGLCARIGGLERDEQERLRLVDLWRFQKKEIDAAKLQPGEDHALEAEKRVLANSEKVYGAAMAAFDLLYENEQSASASLRAAVRQVEELSRYDEKFRESIAALDSASLSLDDVAATLRDYAQNIDTSPERLAEVEDRLALLERLKRKYGQTVNDVIAFGEETARKLAEMENKDEVLRHLRAELNHAAADYLDRARVLSRLRFEAARKLEKLVESEINDLAMKARFKIEVAGSDEEGNWTAAGFDEAKYLISANPGEPLGPVEEIASGGELSRVMLALKAAVASGPCGTGFRPVTELGRAKEPTRTTLSLHRTLVFDEIDTGIGGRAAEAVGKKLKSLARSNQVLCITHLPQIACFADRHFLIEKKIVQGRTHTSIRPLEMPERTEELARMLSGAKLTDAALKNAEQMLKAGAGQ
jgi:DNA repair protein RecN (Recombination protein N)